jgi:hypothetical protein
MAARGNGILATLLLGCAFLVGTNAAADSQRYLLEPTSTITPSGGSAQQLTGEIELTFRGFCFVPFDLAACSLQYDIDGLSLSGGGQTIVLGSVTPILGDPVLALPDFGINLPGAPRLDDFVLERRTRPPQFPQEMRYFERVLDSANPNTAAAPLFGAGPLPSEIFFDVELIEKELLQVFSMGDPLTPRTTSSEVVARLAIHAVAVPEPGSGALVSLGLAVLSARRSPRRQGSRP